jgi:adenylate cyclase class 2
MLEVEMKFPVADFVAVEATLRAWDARVAKPIEEADHYFNAPDRDFARTDEAFRLRRVGPSNCLTYKGPKSPGLAKTRTEIEVPLADGPDVADGMCSVLVHLGYRPVTVVRKQRQVYHCRRGGFDLQVCLDDVAEVGQFVEVEIVTPPEQRCEAERILLETTRELNLHAPERRSYLEMLLTTRESTQRTGERGA